MLSTLRLLFCGLVTAACAFAAQSPSSSTGKAGAGPSATSRADSGFMQTPQATASASSAGAPTDPSYLLNSGDSLMITVSTQSDQIEASAAPTISNSGDVRLPWIEEDIKLSEKSVRDAERYLEHLYKERGLLNRPRVSVKVSQYFQREFSVLGAVRSPGTFPFPPNTVSLDIAEVITKVGGFSPIARANAVRVTHREANGKETETVLDLESLVTGRTKGGKARAEFPIYPGDRIFVPESFL